MLKKKLSLHNRIMLKQLFHSILQFVVIFTFGYLNECIFEIAVIYCCFFIFRSTFEKQFHASTSWLCTLYTIIIYFIVSCITPRKEISLILIVLFTFSVNYINFLVREFLDLKTMYGYCKNIKIKKGMSKEELLKICQPIILKSVQLDILMDFYVNRKSITYIARKQNYSYDRIWQLKNEALIEIEKFYKSQN